MGHHLPLSIRPEASRPKAGPHPRRGQHRRHGIVRGTALRNRMKVRSPRYLTTSPVRKNRCTGLLQIQRVTLGKCMARGRQPRQGPQLAVHRLQYPTLGPAGSESRLPRHLLVTLLRWPHPGQQSRQDPVWPGQKDRASSKTCRTLSRN